MEGSEIRGSSEAVSLTPRSGLGIYLAHETRPRPRPRPRKRFRFRIRFRFRFPRRLTASLRHFGEATRSFLQGAASVPGRLKRSAEQHRELGRPSGIQYMYIYIYIYKL